MNKIKENRVLSFIIIAIIYVLSSLVGILTYRSLKFDWWLNLLIADVVATVFTFIFSLIFKNASVYDPYWSVQPIVIVFAFLFSNKITLLGGLTAFAILVWGVRLTANWAYTFKNLNSEDWRYVMLKEKTGVFYPIINLVGIHLVPTIVVYLCTLPVVVIILESVAISPLSIVFVVLILLSVTLQLVADFEMHKFRKNRTGAFIRVGVWKYSRHPNYLAEILVWWCVGLTLVVSSPSHFMFLIGAVANTVLFLTVSIPLADGRQSKKDGFTEYKEQTRMLLPIKK